MEPAFASAAGMGPDAGALLDDLADRALADLGPGPPPDLAVVFATPDLDGDHRMAGARVRGRTGAARLLGCSAGGVIGADREREDGPGAALLLARLPGCALVPGILPLRTDPPPGGDGAILLLADPFSVDPEALLATVQARRPGWPLVGGLASGGHGPGIHALWSDGETLDRGAVALAIGGPGLAVRAVVSQGCRPVGRRYVVTAAEGNRIRSLAGRPAAEALRATWEGLSPEDRERFRTGVHLGVVAHEARPEFSRGDFLVRNLLGLVEGDGSLVVGDRPAVGQTIQFQLRDAAAASEDLAAHLEREAAAGSPAGGLLFSCGGRGARLFGAPDHDLRAIRDRLGPFPLAGFFCNGEIGPVGPASFLHGFTASMALFSAR
jgi:small ligand-binding sensory domain FIST